MSQSLSATPVFMPIHMFVDPSQAAALCSLGGIFIIKHRKSHKYYPQSSLVVQVEHGPCFDMI